MPTEVIVALFALLGTLSGSYMGVMQSNRLANHRIEETEKSIASISATLGELVKQGQSHSSEIKHLQTKMDRHNSVMERLPVAERDVITLFKHKDNHEQRIQKLEGA